MMMHGDLAPNLGVPSGGLEPVRVQSKHTTSRRGGGLKRGYNAGYVMFLKAF